MFQELMPLLAQRIVLVTLSRVSDAEMCIHVIPKPLQFDPKDDTVALAIPLSVTGTPKELDEQLSGQLVEFVGKHLELSSTLKSAKEQMETAAKVAREAARKSTSAKYHGGSSKTTAPSSPQVPKEAGATDGPDDSQSSPEPAQAAPEGGDLGATSGSLFDLEPKNSQ
jgi:PRTRC genetic system protein E